MWPYRLAVFILFMTVLWNGTLYTQPSNKLSKRLATVIEKEDDRQDIMAWIFFTDKGPLVLNKMKAIEALLSGHAYERRLRSRGAGNLVDEYDVPVNTRYIQTVAGKVSRIRHKSRWLNAVSVEAAGEALKEIAAFPFVEKVDLVFRATLPLPEPVEKPETPQPGLWTGIQKPTVLDYGSSLTQNSLINTPALHDSGYSGKGVIIGMLDSGFNNLGHEALDHLDIKATWDFVNHDPVVSDEAGQMGSGSHGTNTLSVIGGFQPGRLIGPAYGATFVLAKTENTDSERHIEEDNWVAGAEWADSLGADIISSSVGYLDGFTVYGEQDYTWDDMNGETTVVTRGAEIAAGRGIVVVNSAGNEGPATSPQNTLIAPADGEHVLAVGAVTSGGDRAGYSSMGPTADGRIKPDVMAMGSFVYVAGARNPGDYFRSSGTSFSCPLVAGTAALLLEANPRSSNALIMDALRVTAVNAMRPNNSVGWGIVDALKAHLYIQNGGTLPTVSNNLEILRNAPNPFNETTVFQYNVPTTGEIKLEVYNVLGQKVATLLNRFQGSGARPYVWTPGNLPSGVYIVVLSTNGQHAERQMIYVK